MSPIQIPFFRELAEQDRFFRWSISQAESPTVIAFQLAEFVIFIQKYKPGSGPYAYSVQEFEFGIGRTLDSGPVPQSEVRRILHEFASDIEMKVAHAQ